MRLEVRILSAARLLRRNMDEIEETVQPLLGVVYPRPDVDLEDLGGLPEDLQDDEEVIRRVLTNEHLSETLRKMFSGEPVETVKVDWRD
jgi:ATP-dependent 26S proteasome regulatory subunit